MVLELDLVNVSYDETRVIKDLSLKCESDEIVAVLGRNGMGKTTLLKSIAGALPVDSGTIVFRDEDVTDLPSHERAVRGITLIPQGREIFPDLTVEENLKMGGFASQDRGTIDEETVYEYFPILEERLEQKGGTLSGGQQQMLAIARGLMTNPEIILLDEPSEGIQPSIVDQIAELLPRIHENEGIPIILVEQNVELVFGVADRGYVIENGRIVESDNVDDLRDDELIRKRIGI